MPQVWHEGVQAMHRCSYSNDVIMDLIQPLLYRGTLGTKLWDKMNLISKNLVKNCCTQMKTRIYSVKMER